MPIVLANPRSTAIVAVISAVTMLGCGDARPASHPVSGVVTLDGQPLAEAMVVFHPLGDQPADMPKPLAHSDEQGAFVLTTFATSDGAPAGKYAITVELRAPREVGEEIVRDGPNILPPQYAQPETSGLTYEVVAGENQPAVIELKSR